MKTCMFTGALLLCSVVDSVTAHHSFFPHFFSDSPVTITGTIIEFEPRNPHAYLHIEAEDENGELQEYVCESSSVTQLQRNGIDPELLMPGTRVTVTGQEHRREEHMCFFRTIQVDNGPVLSIDGAGQPLERTAVASNVSAGATRNSIFGNWLLTTGPPTDDTNREESVSMLDYMTAAGERAVAAYDPFTDDPVLRCDPVGILRVWYAPGTPLEIVREEDRIILRHEWMDVRRTVHLDMDEHPGDGPRTSLGHSIGRFENGVLTIETANFSAGAAYRASAVDASRPIELGQLMSEAPTLMSIEDVSVRIITPEGPEQVLQKTVRHIAVRRRRPAKHQIHVMDTRTLTVRTTPGVPMLAFVEVGKSRE